MDMWLDVDVAVKIPANLFPLIDDTDFKTREIAIAYNQAGMDLVWNFVTSAGVYTQTAVTPTTAGVYDWSHVGDAMYDIEIPASGGASINNDAEGYGWFTGICTGVLAWRSPTYGFRAAALNNALVDGGDVLDVSLTEIGGVAQSATDLKDFADAGYDPATNKVTGVLLTDTVSTLTNKTGFSLSTAGILAIWHQLSSAVVTASTMGKLLVDNVNATISSRMAESSINTTAGAVDNVTTTANNTDMRGTDGALTDKTGFSLSTAGILAIWHQATAAIVTASTIGKLLVDNINTTISSRMATTHINATAGVVDNVTTTASNTDMRGTDGALTDKTGFSLSSAGVLAIWDQATSALTTAGKIGKHIMDMAGATFNTSTDSLEAIRDRGDAAWATGGGGAITDILNVSMLVPSDIDLANTATYRLGMMLINAVDDLPTTAEITPGTISIDRKAIGGTAWSAIVTDAACSEAAGLIYYDEVFDSGAGYAEGDSIRVTFKSQKITVAANDYEISDANGRLLYTMVRQTMRGTDSALTDKTGFSLSTAGILAIWHQLSSAVVTASTMGKLLKDNIDAAISSRMAESSINTTAGVVDNVTTVASNTDMRGTDGALTTKTGFSLSATGLDAIAQSATGMVEIAKAVWDRVLSGATHNIASSAGRIIRETKELNAYGGRLWLDTVNGTAGATDYENGTIDSPVNNIADLITLSNSLGLKRVEVAPESSFTLAVTVSDFVFNGHGWTIALGGQNISGSIIIGAEVSGICTGATPPEFIHCTLGNMTVPPCSFSASAHAGNVTVGSAGIFIFDSCYSAIAGTGAPIFSFGAAIGDTQLSFRHHSGGVQVEQMGDTGTDTISLEGHGQLIEGTCTGGTVALRGSFDESGITNLTVVRDEKASNVIDIRSRLPAALVGGKMSADAEAIGGSTSGATRLGKSTEAIAFGTVGASSTLTNIVTSAIDPAATVIDQFKDKLITFDYDTTTAALRGQSKEITASTVDGQLTVTALTSAPVSGDTFVIT